VPLVAAGSQALLGTFQVPNPNAFEIFLGDDLAGGTVFDAFGHPLVPVSVNSYRLVCGGHPPCVPEVRYYFFVMTFVPEPAHGLLAALAVLGLAAQIRRRKGSDAFAQ
jgi:MYXO-CTERM domain-containing protein